MTSREAESLGAVSKGAGRHASAERKVEYHESETVRKAHVREVQNHPPQGTGYDYLREPQAQAETGLIDFLEV